MTKYHPTNSIYTFLDVHEVATGPKTGRLCVRWQTAYMPTFACSYFDTLEIAKDIYPLVQERVIAS